MISVYFVYLRELAYADNDSGYLSLSLYAAVKFIKETILVAKAGQRINVPLYSVASYSTDEIIRFT